MQLAQCQQVTRHSYGHAQKKGLKEVNIGTPFNFDSFQMRPKTVPIGKGLPAFNVKIYLLCPLPTKK